MSDKAKTQRPPPSDDGGGYDLDDGFFNTAFFIVVLLFTVVVIVLLLLLYTPTPASAIFADPDWIPSDGPPPPWPEWAKRTLDNGVQSTPTPFATVIVDADPTFWPHETPVPTPFVITPNPWPFVPTPCICLPRPTMDNYHYLPAVNRGDK